MLHSLVVAVLIFNVSSVFAASSKPDFAMGMAMESRLEQNVNPDYAATRFNEQLYGKLRFWPWAVLLEGGLEGRESSSGSYRVKTQTGTVAAWARYEFIPVTRGWSPFVSIGVGAYFDRVNTQIDTYDDTRSSRRGLMGLGGGLTASLWRYLLLEAEGRISGVQERKDPLYSALLRIGVQI